MNLMINNKENNTSPKKTTESETDFERLDKNERLAFEKIQFGLREKRVVRRGAIGPVMRAARLARARAARASPMGHTPCYERRLGGYSDD